MRVTREFLQKVVLQEYRKLLSENIDDMQDMNTNMNMFGSGYEAAETDEEEHVHDENCGHDYESEETEHDDESRMFRSHLTSISKQVEELENLVQQGENVEEWVQEKMAVAASMIDSIYHYLSHGEESSEETDDYDDEVEDDETDEYDDDMEMDYDEVEDDETDEYDDEMEMDDDELEDDELFEQSDYVGMDPAQYPSYGYKKKEVKGSR